MGGSVDGSDLSRNDHRKKRFKKIYEAYCNDNFDKLLVPAWSQLPTPALLESEELSAAIGPPQRKGYNQIWEIDIAAAAHDAREILCENVA